MGRQEQPQVRQRLDRRESLLVQLEYLLVELEALEPLLEEIPEALLTARPTQDPSVLEAFAELARRDQEARALVGGTEAERHDAPAQLERGRVLAALRHARREFLETLDRQDPDAWDQQLQLPDGEAINLFDLLELVVEQDVQVLRSLGDRLRTANLHGRLAR